MWTSGASPVVPSSEDASGSTENVDLGSSSKLLFLGARFADSDVEYDDTGEKESIECELRYNDSWARDQQQISEHMDRFFEEQKLLLEDGGATPVVCRLTLNLDMCRRASLCFYRFRQGRALLFPRLDVISNNHLQRRRRGLQEEDAMQRCCSCS